MRKHSFIRSVAGFLAVLMTFYGVMPTKAFANEQIQQGDTAEVEWLDQAMPETVVADIEEPVPQTETVPWITAAETTVPTDAAQETMAPTDATQETTAPTEAAQETTAPTEAAQETTAPTEAAQETTAPTDAAQQVTVPTDPTKETVDPTGESKPEEIVQNVYQDGVIRIYSFQQLQLLGTGVKVTSLDDDPEQLGQGKVVTDETGQPVTYSMHGTYTLAQDILIPEGMLWQVPQGFTGRIAPVDTPNARQVLRETEVPAEVVPGVDQSESAPEREGNDSVAPEVSSTGTQLPLYDAPTDTIYIYHPYQLAVMAMDNAADQPVLDQDADAQSFGMGQPILLGADGTAHLTYGPDHTYVLSSQFCSDRPEILSVQFFAASDNDGRDFAGQLIKTIGDKDYILIGNADQLRAIGSNKPVMGAVYQAYKSAFGSWTVDSDKNDNPIMLYGGDADLLQSQNGKKDYSFGVPDGTDSSLSDKGIMKGRCGVDPKTGEIDPELDIETLGKTYTYSNNANYIIFRDIDLGSVKWEPLQFYGNMIGAKSAGGGKLWDDTGTNIISGERPVISNVLVNQEKKRNSDGTMGVGFFSTIESEMKLTTSSLSSPDPVIVKNLVLENVSVTNGQTAVHHEVSIINGLLGALGAIVGTVLDVLLIPIFGISFRELLTDLLTARKAEPSFYATGGFAGRIVGNALVSGCEVRNVTVSNVTNFTGGFVGYTEGTAHYLLQGLGKLIQVLENLLNAVPLLGLGDLVKVLVKLLGVDKLIVTGYDNPVIANCTVTNLSGSVGNKNAAAPAAIGDQTLPSGSYAGGFVGAQIGTQITDCTVQNSTYTVLADQYGGGFAGITRDGEIDGILEKLGVELLKIIQPQSLLMACQILNSNVTVSGGSYLGGFTGALASSYAVNDTITGSLNVSGTGSYVGGVAGTATLGWVTNLGADEVKEENLFSTLKELLLRALGNPNSNALLSLVGLSPSAILGVQVDCTDIQISADGDYAGGILGKGDGAYLANSSKCAELPAWKHGKFSQPASRGNSVTGLSRVHTGGSYAGGAVGEMVPASAAGVLDGTLGLANMLGFTLTDLTLSGDNISVTAGNRYAGGVIGEAMGGQIENVTLSGISEVTAKSRAGGFAGVAGPGDLAGSNGLELKLLGIKVLEINNLLAVGQSVRVTGNNCTVNGGAETGLTVTAMGSDEQGTTEQFTAAGFIAKGNSTEFENCHVENLLCVSAPDLNGYAGGFVGTSESGGLADVADKAKIKDLLSVSNLVTAVGYLIPQYTNCTVAYLSGGGVNGDVAGGFAADFRSGKVDNTDPDKNDPYAVYNIDHVNGQSYAGGFGGRVTSGALANAGGGLSILGGLTGVNINISDLLSVVEAYVPYVINAGVQSEEGFTVSAPVIRDTDANSGSAGGFIGYASGAQVSKSNVNRLKHTKVTPPADLEAVAAPSYFDGSSSYAVYGQRYAGGYVGHLDIGSAASLGGGLKILGETIQLTNILDALSVVVSTVEHSSVIGSPGGFAVRGDYSGGFAGKISGGHVQNCHAKNFSYIIGLSTAGGYVGNLLPGNVANVLENTSILGGLVSADEALASLAEDFVPSIRNSTASGIPCGGAVRAHEKSTEYAQKGCAGGYVGLNEGGQIRGNDTSRWKKEDPYSGPQNECKVERIDSVYGYEYAGGYTGLMRSADTVKVGGLDLLGGLIKIGNILGALSITYPTQTDTATYGPLANMDVETWNAWVEYVGKYGGRGEELAKIGRVETQDQLNAILKDFVYGYTVASGRTERDEMAISEGASAGGYVGMMISGVITNGQAHDVKAVQAMGNAGGYAGKMRAGGAAEFGTVSILGLNLNLGQLVQAAQFFVPVIKGSSVEGYRSGMTVTATGKNAAQSLGNAGGYVGSAYGAQIWGDKPNADSGCNVLKLQRVTGNYTAGGYAGFVTAGAVAKVNTNMADNFLQSVLDHIIGNLGDLLSIMKATVTTIRGAKVTPAAPDYGFVVGGDADYSGGFGGWLEAAIIGSSKDESQITVDGLRYVEGGLYSGGFFGLADVTGVAQVGSNGTEGGKTSIIGLIKAGKVDVLDAFRTYIYHADVHGVEEGLTVLATRSDTTGILDSKRHMGSAGGFGGGMMNGSIHNCTITNLNTVQGLNYVGGFVGHLGKNGVVKADDGSVGDLLGLNAGVLNIFGAHTEECSVSGIPSGFEVRAMDGETPMVGGFSGYADLSRVKNSTVTNLKKVESPQIAGGFVGKTDMGYLVQTQVDSALVDLVLKIVNELVKFLYLDKVQDVNLIKIQLPPPLNKLLELQIMGDGNLVYVNLLGLKIGVSLSKAEPGKPGQTDTVIVTIGDSQIKLPCSENGIDTGGKHPEIEIALIKGNRTKIEKCSVSGISLGYDVYGGGAGDTEDGIHEEGHAGGFVGLNHEGMLIGNQMYWCDVVRGTPEKVGPFTGTTELDSVYEFNTVKGIEGDGNIYRVYRPKDDSLSKANTDNGNLIADAVTDNTYQMVFNRFDVPHLEVIREYQNFEGAVMTDGADSIPLGVYESSAKAVLMRDTNLPGNHNGITPEPGESPDPCEQEMGLTITKVWKDWYNRDIRPESIQVEIWQSYTDAQGMKHDVLNQTVTISTADVQKETETWKKVISDLPVAKKEMVHGQEVICYYQYSVKEVPVPGYHSEVSTGQAGQIIITNTATMPSLPSAGGIGDWWFITIGGLFVMLGLSRRRRNAGKPLQRKP